MMPPDQHIFLIGFNKSGTSSFESYFASKGLRTLHGSRFDTAIYANIARRLKPLTGFDRFDAYADSEAIQYSYRALAADYPRAKFILNIRDVDRWILSRLNHLDGRFVEFMNLYTRQSLSWEEWVTIWRRDYGEHERDVLAFFAGQADRFMRFDIDRGRFAELVAFIGDSRLDPGDTLPVVKATATPHYRREGDRFLKL